MAVDADFEAVQRSIETLLRLNASRKVHADQAAAARADLSQPGFSLLGRVAEAGPLSLGDLARATHMDPALASRQVRLLEEQGFVRRVAHDGDRRITLVDITPRGRDARRRMDEVRTRHMWDALAAWSPADREQLGALLDRFVDDLRAVRYRPTVEDRSA
jgi:DNA-binding MarR family transcriptional regulator